MTTFISVFVNSCADKYFSKEEPETSKINWSLSEGKWNGTPGWKKGADRGSVLFRVRVLSHTYGTYCDLLIVEKLSAITNRKLEESHSTLLTSNTFVISNRHHWFNAFIAFGDCTFLAFLYLATRRQLPITSFRIK